MYDPSRSNQELLKEITILKQKIQDLGKSVSERKQLEDELRKNKQQFQELVETLPDWVWEVDPKGQYTYVSPRVKAILGYEPEDIIGKTPFDLMPVAEAQRVAGIFGPLVLQHKPILSLENINIHKDGHLVVLETTGLPFYDAHGNFTGYRGADRDITLRKQVGEALNNERSFTKLLLDTSPAFFVAIDNAGKTILMNPALLNALEYAEQEVQGTDYLTTFVPEEDRESLISTWQKVPLNNEPTVNENCIVSKSGRRFLVEWHGRTVMSHDGFCSFIAGVGIDITNRKRSEEELKKSKLLLESVFNSSQDLILVIDRDLRVLMSNWKSPLFSGHTEFSTNPHCYGAFVHRDTPCEPCHALSVFNTGKPILTEYFNQYTGLFKEVYAYPILDDNNYVIMVAEHVRDITDRKLAERALRESEENFRLITETIEDVFWMADVDIQKMLYVSPSYEKIWGRSRDSLYNTPQSFIDQIHHEDKERVIADWELKKIGQPFEHNYRIILPDGSIRWIWDRGFPVKPQSGSIIRCYAGIAKDVTERKMVAEDRQQMEERLQRSEKMEALGLLSGGVAHDLNNVLGILTGYSELLLHEIEESSPVSSYATNIMKASESAGAIIQDMLTLARRGVQTRQAVNLNTLIGAFMKSPEFERLTAFHPNVRVETNLETESLNIIGSFHHISKTIMNLVSNAAEAMSQGGLLTISTCNRYMDCPVQGYDEVREGDYVVLSVSDTGEGISGNDIKHIFEPFYTKKVMGRSGTGLGLAVVWGTVKDHDGYIDVQSEEGKGSTFSLYFPVTRGELSEERISVSKPEYIGKGESILVVDDIEGQRELAARMLEKLNYRVDIVASGEEAFEYTKDHQVDLVVLDMIMDPGIDGLDTYRKILEIHPHQRAIIVSGFSETERVKQAKDLGAGAYVKKPYIMEKLGLAVRKELDAPNKQSEV